MSGYIGAIPTPQATQSRDVYTATSNQTTFTTQGYTPNLVSVYLNGVHLARADYTATNGSDVVLASGATANDTVEIVAFSTFETGNSVFTSDVVASGATLQATGDTAAGDDAAIGYTAAEGIIITGQGTTNDVTIKNDADADVIEIPTGTTSVTMTGSLKPLTYQETYVSKSAASTVTCDLATANHFAVTLDQNTTFAFTNPPTSGTSFAFTLIVTQHSTAVTLTWPNTVDWAGGSAPDAAGNNEVQAYGFITRDGGTTYYGFLGGTAIA
jgi:hypothetical protein